MSFNEPTCFVIMPFTEKGTDYPDGHFDDVYKSLIMPACDDASFRAFRVDDTRRR